MPVEYQNPPLSKGVALLVGGWPRSPRPKNHTEGAPGSSSAAAEGPGRFRTSTSKKKPTV
jgi:hypothetical protein